MRNHTGATQKTNFIADVSLVRNNWLLQSNAISSDGKSPSTSDSKKQKNYPTHCCSRITSEKNSKQGSDKIYCYDRLRHTDNVKVRNYLYSKFILAWLGVAFVIDHGYCYTNQFNSSTEKG